jgi:hypothetical protein
MWHMFKITICVSKIRLCTIEEEHGRISWRVSQKHIYAMKRMLSPWLNVLICLWN